MFIASINAHWGGMTESRQNSGEKACTFHTEYLPEFSQGSHGFVSPTAWSGENGRKDPRSMELPRGRFRGVRRNARLALLLQDLSSERFTGYCKILHEQETMVIVLEEGSIILAEGKGASGDEALAAVLASMEFIVDAELDDLDASELKLAVEFNTDSKVDGALFINSKVVSPSSCEGIVVIPDPVSPQSDFQPLSAPQGVTRDRSPFGTEIAQENLIDFEPLNGDSVLFEARQDVKKGFFNVPDLSERWQFMGVTRNENPSV
jgi:hypothetical protein